MKIYLDGTEYENPNMWETLQERLYFSDVIGGYLLELSGSVDFYGGAYTYLYSLFNSGTCNTVSVLITDNCADGSEVNIFEGLIFVSDIEFEIVTCKATVEFVDNSFISKIDNNKSIKCYLGVTRSKNDVDISAFSTLTSSIVLRSKTNVNDITTGNGYRIFDAFRFLIAFMTDGTVNFVSDYFDPSGTGLDDTAKYTVLMNGEEIRTGAATNYSYISYEDFYNDINKIFNIAFSVENINGTPTIRIEPKNYYKQTGEINYFEYPEQLKQVVSRERLYAKVKFGSAQVAGTFTYLPDLVFDGFEQEEYHLLGDCNSQAVLDLQLTELITDTNIIQDVLPSGSSNTAYDKNNFLIVLDSTNTNESYLKVGSATDYYYNKPLSNYAVSVYWFGGIPQSIAQFIGSTDTFRASRVTTNLSIPFGAPVTLIFNDDSTFPNYDTSGNYDPVTGRFTAPANGYYAFELNQILLSSSGSAMSYTTYIYRYNSANVLQETIFGGAFVPPFILGLTVTGGNGNTTYVRNYVWGFTMSTGDYIVIQGEGIFGSSWTLMQGSYYQSLYAVSGGGYVQEYDNTDMDLIENSIDHSISCDTWQTIKSTPFKTFTIQHENGIVKGWLNEISRNIKTGEATVIINSKPNG